MFGSGVFSLYPYTLSRMFGSSNLVMEIVILRHCTPHIVNLFMLRDSHLSSLTSPDRHF
jgi:hypothetical protein